MQNYTTQTLQKTGSRHRCCQDRYAVHQEEGLLIMVVCDGHGGRPYCRSGLGARFAAAAAVAVLKSETEVAQIPAAIKDRYDAMVKKHLAARPLNHWEALRAEDMPRHLVYGTTLLAAVIKDRGATVYQLGDGEIHAVSPQGELLPDLPEDTSCRGNLTSSLACNRDFALAHFRTAHYENVGALLMLSDGCDNGFLQAMAALADFPNQTPGFDAMLTATDRGDDQTMLLAYDPEALRRDSVRETLKDNISAIREARRQKQLALQEREEYLQLANYMELALRKAARLRQEGNPALKDFLKTLQPSYLRYIQLHERLLAETRKTT